MKLTEEQEKSFQEAILPILKWLNENCHPHVSVIVTPTDAELLEGIAVARTTEFLND